MNYNDIRLIEHGFPCHQVGAETLRERDTGKAPPTHSLHVWWARRPLTPSRAAILASLLPADTDLEEFIRSLGIEKCVTYVNEKEWTLTDKLLNRIQEYEDGEEYLPVDQVVLRALNKEQQRRKQNRDLIAELKAKDSTLQNDPVLKRWEEESQLLPEPWPEEGAELNVKKVMGDPAGFKMIISLAQQVGLRVPNMYGYDRAFLNVTQLDPQNNSITVLDPTAGGGSIPFEALRLGYKVIANEFNPVAVTILHSTLNYPSQFGVQLYKDIQYWGERLIDYLEAEISSFFSSGDPLPKTEKNQLKNNLNNEHTLIDEFD